jgi:hypothetical protein
LPIIPLNRLELTYQKKITTLQNKTVQPGTGSHQDDRTDLARSQKGKMTGKAEDTGDFWSIGPYETETTLEDLKITVAEEIAAPNKICKDYVHRAADTM